METEQKVAELTARFDAMTPESREKIIRALELIAKMGESVPTHTTNGTDGQQDTCASAVDNSKDPAPTRKKMYQELPELDGTEPTLTELGLTLRDEAREMVDTLFNRLTESERLIPEKWVFYRLWNDLPKEYQFELENAASDWSYTLLRIGAALAFQLMANPGLMLESPTKRELSTGGRRHHYQTGKETG